jgi:hypothetical protein
MHLNYFSIELFTLSTPLSVGRNFGEITAFLLYCCNPVWNVFKVLILTIRLVLICNSKVYYREWEIPLTERLSSTSNSEVSVLSLLCYPTQCAAPQLQLGWTCPCFFLSNQPDPPVIQIYSVIKLYMFRASSLPIIRSLLLYIRHWSVSCRFLMTASKQSQFHVGF